MMDLFEAPIQLIIVHHSASKAGKHTAEDIKNWHLAKGWDDIGYHDLIVRDPHNESDHQIWQYKKGRDDAYKGAHAKGHNWNSIGVLFEGNYEEGILPKDAFELGYITVRNRLIKYNLKPNIVQGHRHFANTSTLCPGKNFPIGELRGRLQDEWYREGRV